MVSDPGVGMLSDPGAGMLSDPSVGMVSDSAAGIVTKIGAWTVSDPGAGIGRNPGARMINDPGVGMVSNPAVGLLSDPTVRMVSDPRAGMVSDSRFGMVTDSRVGMVRDPSEGMVSDPRAGMVRDPSEGMLSDPGAGMVRDPGAGMVWDPRVGMCGDVLIPRGEIFDRIGQAERDSLKHVFEEGGLPNLVSQILSCGLEQDGIVVNVGVIGEAGAGKSSLVNALRGVPDDHPGAAPTGVTETTVAPSPYPHPAFHHVVLWDLPGLGTPDFQVESYREKVGFHRYDFFIIVASERFKASHTTLAQWIQESGAHFYFVRSKIDNDIAVCQRQQGTITDQHETLHKIREEAVNYLTQQGVHSPQVFLISSPFFEDYDSKQLQETLERDVPKFRKQAFLKSIHPVCSGFITRK
ncbi:interferon-inducible GTPase 5-like, partial [Chiloscyllium plagiosum]|uniref:interferon-inducible GTPase 5-like n=1 Tax=Chiloscyllium plagiosum TaxID=36176 RepID=UPI001CB8529D